MNILYWPTQCFLNDSLNGGSATVWGCSHYKRISLFLELTRNSALNESLAIRSLFQSTTLIIAWSDWEKLRQTTFSAEAGNVHLSNTNQNHTTVWVNLCCQYITRMANQRHAKRICLAHTSRYVQLMCCHIFVKVRLKMLPEPDPPPLSLPSNSWNSLRSFVINL